MLRMLLQNVCYLLIFLNSRKPAGEFCKGKKKKRAGIAARGRSPFLEGISILLDAFPVAGHPIPSVVIAGPVSGHVDISFPASYPASLHPNIAMSVPLPVARDPDSVFMRFLNMKYRCMPGLGRSNLHINAGVRHPGIRLEQKYKRRQQKDSDVFHDDASLRSLKPCFCNPFALDRINLYARAYGECCNCIKN